MHIPTFWKELILMPLVDWLNQAAHLIIAHRPWQAGLIGLAVGWALCPGYMYLLALVVEWRWPRYRDQFKAFMPGNLFLGVVFGSSCYLASSYYHQSHRLAMFSASWWYWVPAVCAFAVVVGMSFFDIYGTIAFKPGAPNRYSWGQLVSWTKLWHNVAVYGAYGILLVGTGLPGLLGAPVWMGTASGTALANDLVRLVLLVCLLRWLSYLWYDIKHPRNQTGHVAINIGQWILGLAVVMATFITLYELVPSP